MAPTRDVTVQTVAWFRDLYTRKLLELDPPYQRRSVWTQGYKDFFIDTVLNGYPCPAVFLHKDIEAATGSTTYSVVDGKQRLSAVLEFVEDKFPVSEACAIVRLRGLLFSAFAAEDKKTVWSYQFLVEYVPDNEGLIENIFDRINRNVSKLSPQELRHAKYDGRFISASEEMTELLQAKLGKFPSIAAASQRQMKDVEFTASLLLFIEHGEKSFSQLALDEAFALRDTDWPEQEATVAAFKGAVLFIEKLAKGAKGAAFTRSRFRNQADFYSLFASIVELQREKLLREGRATQIRDGLQQFIERVQTPSTNDDDARSYFDAARSASNDAGPRRKRIDAVKNAVLGSQKRVAAKK